MAKARALQLQGRDIGVLTLAGKLRWTPSLQSWKAAPYKIQRQRHELALKVGAAIIEDFCFRWSLPSVACHPRPLAQPLPEQTSNSNLPLQIPLYIMREPARAKCLKVVRNDEKLQALARQIETLKGQELRDSYIYRTDDLTKMYSAWRAHESESKPMAEKARNSMCYPSLVIYIG